MFNTIAISYVISNFESFFVPGTATDRYHIERVQHELVTPTFVSPSPDANGGTDLQVFDASDYSTLRLLG